MDDLSSRLQRLATRGTVRGGQRVFSAASANLAVLEDQRTHARIRGSRCWLLAPAAALGAIVVAVGVVLTRPDGGMPQHAAVGAGDAVEFRPTWLPTGYQAAPFESLGVLGSHGVACLDGAVSDGRVSCRRVV